MILPLYRQSSGIWKQKFVNIAKITPQVKKLVSDMKETLELTSGVGLAAAQVGKPFRLFVVNHGPLKETFINPKIIRYGKETNQIEEGCLSVPGTKGQVNRPTEAEIEYIDLKGRRKRAKLTGYYARIVQHEYDHLSSTFYLNRVVDKSKIYTYKPIKTVFFGTSEFGAIILKTIYGQTLVGEYDLQLVVTAPDKPAGRGKKIISSEVNKLSRELNLPALTPVSLKDPWFVKQLKKLEPDFIVLASYGKIIPKEILVIAKKGAVNIHPSLLPKYRGPSPVQAAILKGEKYTGVTIMKMNEKMDEGDILASARLRISKNDTTTSLSNKLAELGRTLIHHILHLAAKNRVEPRPQNHKLATYTKILTKQDGLINWKRPPKNLERMVRAYHPWPGVWTYYQTTRNKQHVTRKTLKLLPNGMVQLEGRQPVTLKEFKTGHKDFTLSW